MPDLYYDGDYTVMAPVSGLEKEYVLSLTGTIFKQRFQQLATSISTPPLGTAGSASGMTPAYSPVYFIGDGPYTDVGAGIVEWERQWASIPGNRTETRQYNFRGQKFDYMRVPWFGYSDTSGFHGQYKEFHNLYEYTKNVAATVSYVYVRGASVAQSYAQTPYHITLASRLNTVAPFDSQTYVIIEGTLGIAESNVTLWKGDIYEIETITVPSSALVP